MVGVFGMSIMITVAVVCFSLSRKSKKANEDGKARIWMIASIIAGGIAVVSIAVLIASL